MEVLRLDGGHESFERLRDVLARGSVEERAHALGELIEMGKMSGSVPDVQLAHVLDVLVARALGQALAQERALEALDQLVARGVHILAT